MTAFHKQLRGEPTGGSVAPGPTVEPWAKLGLQGPERGRELTRERKGERDCQGEGCMSSNQIMLLRP